MRSIGYIVLTVCALAACMCLAAPEPAIVPAADDWTLDVVFEHPKEIMVQLAPEAKPKRFWYLIITITNSSNFDVDFYPKCDLMTDTFEIVPAGTAALGMVFDAIKRRYRRKYSFLEPVEGVDSKILQGEDHTKNIAIVWPDFDHEARSIKLFISGLGNETAVVYHPIAKDKAGKPKAIYLRKTLELSYNIGGDPIYRSKAKVLFKGKRWVMR